MKNFSSFLSEKIELHTELNPRIWRDGKIIESVRTKLLDIAEAWASFASLPRNVIQDVHLCGGNANYNYTEHSDIDVHLMVERNALGFGPMVDEFLKDKKTLWSLTRHPVVAGYPVELYAQDPSEATPKGQGVFSLKLDHWIVNPSVPDSATVPIQQANRKSDGLKRVIDHVVAAKDLAAGVKLKKRIAKMRKSGIAKGGEFAVENLAFKILRDDGYLDILSNFLTNTEDSNLSI